MTSIATTNIRSMRSEDLPAVMEIEACCYTEIAPESKECLGAKFASSPSTCFVGCQGSEVIAFLIAFPINFESPPQLHASSCVVPNSADTLYLHDLAVISSQRRCGVGRLLINAFLANMKALKYSRASLIAVQNSTDYWKRHGFQPANLTQSLKDTLASYGESACYLERLA